MAYTNLTIVDRSAAGVKWDAVGIASNFQAVDNANGNKILAAADLMILVQNTDSGAHTFSMSSFPVSNTFRKGDVGQSIAAGEERVFRITKDGWQDPDPASATNGYVLLPAGMDTHLKVCPIKLG